MQFQTLLSLYDSFKVRFERKQIYKYLYLSERWIKNSISVHIFSN